MANYAQIVIKAKVDASRKVVPGVTIKFNLFNTIVKYQTFYSVGAGPGSYDFTTLNQLGQKVLALAPNYTYSVEQYSATEDRITITAKYYGINYNFGAFYTSSFANISQVSKLDNVSPASDVVIHGVEVTPTEIGKSNGTANILASGSFLEYKVGILSDWQSSSLFTGLAAGGYSAFVRDKYGGEVETGFTIDSFDAQLRASLSKTDVTASGNSDGTVSVTVTSGNAPYAFLWSDGITTEDRTGLSGGDYSVLIEDSIGQQLTLYVTIYEPDALEKPAPYFYVPDLVSLRYAKEETKDFDRVFPTPENTLFKDSNYPGVTKGGYCQKVSRADIITIQLQSNYDNNILLLNNDSGEVLRVPFEKKLTLTGIQEEYTGFATLAGIGISSIGSTETTYIYPNADTFVSGNVVVISDSVDLNGTYTILSRGFNPNIGQEYVEINKPLLDDETVNPDLEVTVTFINDLRPYDIYEAIINFGSFPAGHYTSVIEASDSRGTQRLVSEPIKLLNSNDLFWEKTSLIEYQNEDNAFNIAYSTEIVNRIRIESRMFKLSPGGESEILRQPNGDIVKISGKAYRGRIFETYKIPNYLHEKLIAIFQHDYILINKQQVQTDENYEVDYADFSPYANGTIDLEVLGWFDKGNGHDPGNGMTGTGFIIANEGFILR